MLETCTIEHQEYSVRRLASVPERSIEEILISRGVDPESTSTAREAMSGVGIPMSASDVLEDTFRGRTDKPTPFRSGRFGDGTIAVYYAALDDQTCIDELAYHLGSELTAMNDGGLSEPRFYSLIVCNYRGLTADLRDKVADYPDLTSVTEEGYPFCQSLARHQVFLERKVEGFLTISARNPEGYCTPVFQRGALNHPEITSRGRFFAVDSEVQFEWL